MRGFRDFAVETYGRMSDAARKTVKDMVRMYEELHGGGGCAPMTRAQFIDFVRRVISVGAPAKVDGERAVCTKCSGRSHWSTIVVGGSG
jgi:hypothetical protein